LSAETNAGVVWKSVTTAVWVISNVIVGRIEPGGDRIAGGW
jgi:hypothetical protein